MPKYNCKMGDPLDMLVEECCEVIQAVMKYRRFHDSGVDLNPATGLNSREQIVQELGDVLAVIDLLQHEPSEVVISSDELAQAKARKMARLDELFGLS